MQPPTPEDVLRALANSRTGLRPKEILRFLGLDPKIRNHGKTVDRRLRDLKRQGLVEHDRATSTHTLAPPTDLEGAILHTLRQKPLTRTEIRNRLSGRRFTEEQLKAGLKKLETYSRIEDVRGASHWSQDDQPPGDEPRYSPSPQEWTTEETCFLCLEPLGDGDLLLADDRTPQFGGVILVHTKCAADRPGLPDRLPACAKCGLPLLPRDNPPVRTVDAFDVLDDMGYAEMRRLVPVLHAIGTAMQGRPTPSRFDEYADGRPPTAEELLPRAFPLEPDHGLDQETIRRARSTVFLWCLSDLSRLEQARNLAHLIHYLDDDLPADGLDAWAQAVHAAATRIRMLREHRYLEAYGQLLSPVGEVRRYESPHWLLGEVGRSRGRQWGLDGPLFGKPIQTSVVRENGKLVHPGCATLTPNGGSSRRSQERKPTKRR